MEERKEEGEAEIQEHGPEHWFSKWERQCLAEAEQDEQLPPELQEEAAAAAQPEHKQQKLWHLFQNSATAVAQLYKGEGRRRRHFAPPPPPRARPSAESPGSGWLGSGRRNAAPPPPPRKMAPREAGPREAAGGRRGGRPGLGPPVGPSRSGGRAAGCPRAGEGRGGAPGHKMAKGGGSGALLCRSRPRGGDCERVPSFAAHLSRLRSGAPRLPLQPRRDPLLARSPPSAGSRNP